MSPELNALVETVARALERLGPDAEANTLALAAIRAVAEATREPPARIKTATGFGIPTTTADEHWRAMHAASPLGEALRDG